MVNHTHLALISLLAVACAADAGESAPGSDARTTPIDSGDGQVDYSVLFQTTTGSFTIDVTRSWSPNGADRFRDLVEDQFFDGARFFRVVPGFVVQFGLSGTPAVDAMWGNMPIPDDAVIESNLRGYVTFAATSQPNSRDTQIFINYVDNSFLDPMGFSPFGVVRETGMQTVDAINSEYGEQPAQNEIQLQGNGYLDANFPNLDFVESARIQ